MSTITQEQYQAIANYLASHELPAGLGTKESACSIAAINIALSGQLSDTIPDCMSRVIGRWIIRTQDAMPHDIRNSQGWKSLLPLAAGTGRDADKEKQRLALIMEWMWSALAELQPLADQRGFGRAWRKMIADKTVDADAVAAAADAAADAAYAAYPYAAVAAAADAAADAADAYADDAAADAVDAAADAVDAAADDADDAYWQKADPIALLERLVTI